MNATLKELDEVLAKHDCDEGYDNEGSDFLSRNRAEIRAALELKARITEPTPEMLAILYSAATGGDWMAAPLPLTKRQLARAREAFRQILNSAPPAQESNDG